MQPLLKVVTFLFFAYTNLTDKKLYASAGFELGSPEWKANAQPALLLAYVSSQEDNKKNKKKQIFIKKSFSAKNLKSNRI